jgi:predicted HTH transcriptional regulator
LGVREKNGHFYPEGLTEEQVYKYEKMFWDGVNNVRQVSSNLMTNKDVVKGVYEGNYIMMFFVPRAAREQRPVYVGENPMRGTYRRNASGDYLCKEWEVSIMLAEQRPMLGLDQEVLEGFTMDDIDPESLRGFRQLFTTVKPSHVWADDDDLTLLKHLKAYRKDRKTGVEGLTLAGLLMFGKYDSITDALPQYMIDFRKYDEEGERWSDRIYSDGTWEANLYQAYRRILPELLAILPAPFRLDGLTRVDETSAHKAMREAFVNFCVHASYQSDAKLVISKYPTELVFSNPGTMLISTEQYYSGGESICRNPALQTMFSLIGASEKAGSGADTIMQGWKEAQYRTPMIVERTNPNKVELYLPLEAALSDDVKAKLVAVYGKSILNSEPNKLKVLALAVVNPYVSNAILQHALDLHRVDITALLKLLCQEELLVASGVGRGTTYVVNKEYASTHPKEVGSTILEPHVGASLGASLGASSGASSARNKLENSEILVKIAACTKSWRSMQEIVRLTCINYHTLRNKVLPYMLANGLVELLYPEQRTHPMQKYKVTKAGLKLK